MTWDAGLPLGSRRTWPCPLLWVGMLALQKLGYHCQEVQSQVGQDAAVFLYGSLCLYPQRAVKIGDLIIAKVSPVEKC